MCDESCTQISNVLDFVLAVIKLMAARLIDTNNQQKNTRLLLHCKPMGVQKLIKSDQLNSVLLSKWLNKQLCAGRKVFTCEIDHTQQLKHDRISGGDFIGSYFKCAANDKDFEFYVHEFK